MKKKLAFILAILMGISSFSSMVFTTESECTDNLPDSVIVDVIQNGEWIANEDGSYSFVLEKATTSLARSGIKENERINYTLIPLNEEAVETLAQDYLSARSGGSKTITDNDSAYYVSAFTVISWADITVNGREMVYLTDVSGGYSAEGSGAYIASGVSVTAQDVTIGQNGFTLGSYEMQNFRDTIDPGTRSFAYDSSYFSDWEPVENTRETTTMGIDYVITLKRGTSSEYFK